MGRQIVVRCWDVMQFNALRRSVCGTYELRAKALGEFVAESRSVLLNMIHRVMCSSSGVSPALRQLDAPGKLAQKRLSEPHGRAHANSKRSSSESSRPSRKREVGNQLTGTIPRAHLVVIRRRYDCRFHEHAPLHDNKTMVVTSGAPRLRQPASTLLGYLRIYPRVAA